MHAANPSKPETGTPGTREHPPRVPTPLSSNDSAEVFYKRAFTQVMWFVGVALTIVGVIVPVVVAYLQSKNFDEKEQELELHVKETLGTQLQAEYQTDLQRSIAEMQQLNSVEFEAAKQEIAASEAALKDKTDAAAATAATAIDNVNSTANNAIERLKLYESTNEAIKQAYLSEVQGIVKPLGERIDQLDSHIWALTYSGQGDKYVEQMSYALAASQYLKAAKMYITYQDVRNSRVEMNKAGEALDSIVALIEKPKATGVDITDVRKDWSAIDDNHSGEIDLDVTAIGIKLSEIEKIDKIIDGK
jgi:DNA repair exonuclease SbcCD ATPase subunit